MMQSCHEIHNVHNKSDNSKGQLKYYLIQFANKERFLRFSCCLSFQSLNDFFLVKRNFFKKEVIICGQWHASNMKVKCDL